MLRILSKILLSITSFLFVSNTFAQTEKQFISAGNEAYETAKYDEAIVYYQQALKFSPKNSAISYKTAMSFFYLKDYESAAKYFDKLSDNDNNNLELFYKAINLKYLGEYKDAIRYFKLFNNNYPIDGFYKQKSQQEIASCYWALDQNINTDTEIKHYPKPLNTPYSDFGANYIDSSILQVSSFLPISVEDNSYQSTLFFYEKNGKKLKEKTEFSFMESESDSFSYANGFYLKENEEFYYSKCYVSHESYETLCDLYVRSYDGKIWGEPKALNINTVDFTETQAHAYINEKGETILYFVSNRLGGQGKLDIWTAKKENFARFSSPKNLPSSINSIDDESTPFFNTDDSTLYFSSNWHYGFGGFDIFKSKNNGTLNFSKPENLGEPINSCADDMYYTPTAYQSALFSSNRKGALQLRGSACCFDIYEELYLVKDDSLLLVLEEDNKRKQGNLSTKNEQEIKLANFIEKVKEQLPATVYFHNDEPLPKSLDTITTLNYEDAYLSYQNVKNEYKNAIENSSAIDDWFTEVDMHFKDLQLFLTDVETILNAKKDVHLLLEGYCSPLALNDYNINLAKRRIVSVQNYILSWKDEALRPYFNGGYLTFSTVPFGEEKADQNISDNRLETEKSVYSIAASKERRAAIIAIEID